MEGLKELIQFMKPTERLDLKAVALIHVLGLTATPEGKSVIYGFKDIIVAIFNLTNDSNETIAKDAVLSLINLTGDADGAAKIYETNKEQQPRFSLVDEAVKQITDENSSVADPWTMVLCNITRVEWLAHEVLNELEKDNKTILRLAKAFAKLDYNKKKGKLDYLGPLLCNLTQSSRGRELFVDSKYNLLDKILPFTSYNASLIRRGGVIGILKNVCFDSKFHPAILCDNDDILSKILYPLCGPEEYTDEENDKFPNELQYLPETKTREEDSDLRKMLLESLLQLCATKRYRELLRAKGVYEILREYHKWESTVSKDRDCLLACENVVDILIKKEEEIGLDDYKQVQVPDDVAEKFVQQDTEYLNAL